MDAPPQSTEVADDVFDRDKFLLRVRYFGRLDSFDVCDEQGLPILFVERTRPYFRLPRTLGALLAVSLLAVSVVIVFWNSSRGFQGFQAVAIVVAGIATWVVYLLGACWRFTVYRDDSRHEALLHIIQEETRPRLKVSFEVRDGEKCLIARIQKDFLSNLTRKTWHCYAVDQSEVCTAVDVRSNLSLMFRLQQFTITDGDLQRTLGELKRKPTLLDRRVLDLSADQEGQLDRRIALALGIMLNSIEYR